MLLRFEHSSIREPAVYKSETVIESAMQSLNYLGLDHRERAQTDPPSDPFSTNKNSGLHAILMDDLTRVSKDRCAFCECKTKTLHPYRFRPPRDAAPDDDASSPRSFYVWFAWDWQNFFPICDRCHPGENASYFGVYKKRIAPEQTEIEDWRAIADSTRSIAIPTNLRNRLISEERPLLYAPGQIGKYGSAFTIDRDAYLIGKTERARITIDHFNLNDDITRLQRQEAISKRLSKLKRLGPSADFKFDDMEYGGAWYLTVKRIIGAMLRQSGIRGQTYRHQIRKSVSRLYTSDIWSHFDEFALMDEEDAPPKPDPFATISQRPAEINPPNVQYVEDVAAIRKAARYSAQQPRLKSVQVENFKSLQNISITLPDPETLSHTKRKRTPQKGVQTPCLLMLGENATGKSSFLEAVALCALPGAERDSLLSVANLIPKHLILNPKYLGSPDAPQAEAAHIKLRFHSDNDRGDEQQLDITPTGYVPSNRVRDDFLVFAYGAHRLFGPSQSNPVPKACDQVITLFRDDAMTIDPEKWLTEIAQTNPIDLDTIASALRPVIQLDGEFRDIEIVEDDNGDPVCQINLKRTPNAPRSVRSDTSPNEYIVPTPLRYISSGYRAIIALICDIFKGIMERLEVKAKTARTVPVLILIDEIEAHLHPRWKLEVISGLREALPRATFVMSSHDPLCIRGMNTGEVVVFNRYYQEIEHAQSIDPPETGTLQTREIVETITDFPDSQQLTIEQLLTSDLFQLYSPNDRRMEQEFSRMARILDKEATGTITPNEREALQEFRRLVNNALPIGMTEAERLVQEAVADFLALRRDTGSQERKNARAEAKRKIIARLKAIAGDPNAEAPSR